MKETRFVRELMEMKQRTVLLSFVVAAIFFLLLHSCSEVRIRTVSEHLQCQFRCLRSY